MKKFTLVIAFIITSGVAHAEKTYQCKSFPNRGTATISITEFNRGDSFRIKVKIYGPNDSFSGLFAGHSKPNSPAWRFNGAFTNAFEEIILASMLGSLTPNSNGNIVLNLSASHIGIDPGYGVVLTCK